MKKDQIEQIVFSLKQENTQLFLLKVNKNGLIQRTGTGSIPECELLLSTVQSNAAIFQTILRAVPEHLPATNLLGGENTNENSAEFVLSFYGGNAEGNNAEGAQWELKSGIRIVKDPTTNYEHPLLPVLETIGSEAERATSQLYFDAMIFYAFGARSPKINDSTVLTGPKAYSDKQNLFANYIRTIHANGQFPDLFAYGQKQSYTDAGMLEYKPETIKKDNLQSIHLVPTGARGTRMEEEAILKKQSVAGTRKANPDAQSLTLSIISALTSIEVVFFILMLACIVYFTFYF